MAVDVVSSSHITPTLHLPVDAEHSGIRAAGCLSFGVIAVVAFVVLNLLFPTAIGLVILGAGAAAAGISYIVDHQLRQRWPSGRILDADQTKIELKRPGRVEVTLHPAQPVNVLTWRFTVPRAGRVKKGWYVMALALEQDDDLLAVYTFASPQQFEQMPLAAQFEALQKPSKLAKEKSSVQDMRLAGKMRRLYEAEQVRGLDGAEMTLDQFKQYVQFLQDNYPAWMPR